MATTSRAGREEFVLRVQTALALPTKKQAEELVAVFISCLEDTLLHHLGEHRFTIKLGGLGKLSVRHRPASRKRLGFSGEVREIPPKRKVKFIGLGKLRQREATGDGGTSSQAERRNPGLLINQLRQEARGRADLGKSGLASSRLPP